MSNAIEDLVKLYEHVPEADRLEACQSDLLNLIRADKMVAFIDDTGDVCYKHAYHVTDEDRLTALSIEQVIQSQRETLRRVAGGWN